MLWLALFLFFGNSECYLWKNGIVHYAISDKDYDFHSRDVIHEVLMGIQNLTCLKFFSTKYNPNVTYDKTLYISNPLKKKDCPSATYDFSKNIIDMSIGYKCLNEKDIARIVVEMIRASVEHSGLKDLKKNVNENEATQLSGLLSEADRNYINTHYHKECDALTAAVIPNGRALRTGDSLTEKLSEENIKYYSSVTWPLGVVLYGVDPKLRDTDDYKALINAMSTIQKTTCIVFEEVSPDDFLPPRSFVWFGTFEGADMPHLGFTEGNQTLDLHSFVTGDPGHEACILNKLMIILGVEMMSNRYDRDNYVTINWNNIQQGKQKYLEKAPNESWVQFLRYDFASATHAPVNFFCIDCDLGQTTVTPIKDYMWQRTMEMGHRKDLSDPDVTLLDLLYYLQCEQRLQ